ncbi:MAG: Gfo/Idh/MocA family oxidoreductase [Pirellulales bacterium]|nr:Gfo/Idh/MocA family oxidoreductase [Pirellulales bacterium]
MSNLEKKNVQKKASRRDFLKTSTAAGGLGLISGLSLGRSAHAAGSDILKVGLVGCGSRGGGAAVNAIDVDKGVRLVALADAFADRLQLSRKILKKVRPDQVDVDDAHCFEGFDGYKGLIASGVDVVLLATPPQFRPLHIKACVDAGKHIFAEKPVGVDATGVRKVMAYSEEAKKKGLSFVSGLCWRYNPCAQETIKRVHDGAIGDIVAVHANYLTGTLWERPRKPDWTEMEFQMRNWYYFTWLSGDNNVEQHVHGIDKCIWALGDKPPTKAWAVSGRQVRTEPKFGDAYDHQTVIYEFDDGMNMYAIHRQQAGCYNEYTETLVGTKGSCELHKGIIRGENKWRYKAKNTRKAPAYMGSSGKLGSGTSEFNNMHQIEQDALFKSIRAGRPLNAGDYLCRSTMIGIMGRAAGYTGKKVTWDQMKLSKEDLSPKRYAFDAEPPVIPGPDGRYPVPMPGITKFV